MTLKSVLNRLASLLPPLPDIAHVAEETDAREVNKMLRDGWRLLLVVNVADGCGGHACYVLGKPRVQAQSR